MGRRSAFIRRLGIGASSVARIIGSGIISSSGQSLGKTTNGIKKGGCRKAPLATVKRRALSRVLLKDCAANEPATFGR